MPISATSADLLAEARRLIQVAAERGIAIRLLGGAAVHMAAVQAPPPALRREPKDIDLVAPADAGGELRELLAECGYRPSEDFNILQGSRRLLFHDADRDRQVDVFVGEFEMCHRIPLEERLTVEPATIPLAELLLTKLQIVELTANDRIDALNLLTGHEVADDDGPRINGARVGALCGRDWGLHRTCTGNLSRLRTELADLPGLSTQDQARAAAAIDRLGEMIEAAPKSARWRLRARIGDRVRWYELPEEVDREP